MSKKVASVCFSILFGIFSSSANAYSVTPLSAVLNFSGPGASANFEIENNSDAPIPIEVTMRARSQDLDGKDIPDTSNSADDKFILFPPQLILEPKSHRSVRITWVGGGADSELAFRAIFQQLSVPTRREEKVTAPEGSVKFLLEYSASIYVAPEGAVPKLVLVSAKPDEENPDKLAVIVENQGTAHQVIKGFSLLLKGESDKIFKISDVDAGVYLNKNILAKSKLKILVPMPKGLKKMTLTGEFIPKS